ncbi:MAG TPA: hypothetical protein VNZ64_15660 [Candidatus Acidoferrum sp.]|nr:hypothetical protein [Candidatus Acidoferrum sp.]
MPNPMYRRAGLRPAVLFLSALAKAVFTSAPVVKGQVIDVIGHLATSDYNTYIAAQTYRDWGNEPCVAVNPSNPQEVVVSSFGYGSWISRNTAQLWYSNDGGVTWAIRFAVPAPIAGSTVFVDDQTYAFDSAGVLHGVLMARDSTGKNDYLYYGTTTNINDASAWTWTAGPFPASSPDQPWLALGGRTVAVAYDDLSAAGGVEQRVALSTDNGLTFPAALNQAVGSPGGVPNSTGGAPLNYINPGLRAAVDQLGNVYVIYGMATNGLAGVPQMHYRLNRFSGGTEWDFTSASGDAIGGLIIGDGLSRQGTLNSFRFGNGINALLGNITAVAVNTNGTQVYVVYGLMSTNGTGQLFLRRFQPNGAALVAGGAPLTLSSPNFDAALPSVAVANNGAVGVLFDEFDGTDFHVHLTLSFDAGQTLNTNMELYSFTTNGMVLGYGTLNHDRLLGDYQCLIALGTNFYGVIAGRGNVVSDSVNTTNLIDPFVFTVSSVRRLFPPILSQPARVGGNFSFILTGEADVTYIIQASTDLVTWTPVATNAVPATVRPIVVATSGSRSYYRALGSQ